MTLHRGRKDGGVMATADPCYDHHGVSKIKMIDFDSVSTIPFEHVPSRMLGILPPKTTFSVGGTKYHWKGDTDVFEDKTDTLVAQYQPEGPGPNTGNLVMTEASDESTREIMVLSTIFMQERFEAHKHAVAAPISPSNTLGPGCVSRLRLWYQFSSINTINNVLVIIMVIDSISLPALGFGS